MVIRMMALLAGSYRYVSAALPLMRTIPVVRHANQWHRLAFDTDDLLFSVAFGAAS